MSAPQFGVQFSRPDDEPVPVIGADFSKTLIIETSEDADATTYPLKTPVRISTGDATKTALLGTGMLALYVAAIQAQLDSLNSGADVIIVRVAEGATTADTVADIVEVINSINTIPPKVNATPRIVLAGRTAYRPVDPENAGEKLASPVVAALEANLGKILAVSPVDVDDTDNDGAIDDREEMTSERVIPIGVAAKVMSGTEVVEMPMSPFVVGLFIRVDNAHFGKPFEPIANRPIYGLAGVSRDIDFSIYDGSTDGQQLLEANVSIVVNGEVGVDGAIADGGYYFIGTDNAQTGELWEQFHQVRGADYLQLKFAENWKQHGGRKITVDRIEAWITANAFILRDHKAAGDILGYTPSAEMFKAAGNSAEQVRLGTLLTNIGIEPAPVFKRADHEIRRYRAAVEGLVEDVIARLSAAA